MISKIQIIILILSLVDLTATYFYVSTFHAQFPKLNHLTLEANPILRMAMQKFGIGKGMLFGGIVVFMILLLIVFTSQRDWLLYLAGVLSMMVIYHLLNFSQLAALKGVGGG